MAKDKVKLEWIAKRAARRASFKKRKQGLMQKTRELSTLCGVQACVVVYDPDNQKAEVWPSRQEAESVLARFMRTSELDRKKNEMNVEGYLKKSINKEEVQLKKKQKENRGLEITKLMYDTLAGKVQYVVQNDVCELAVVLEEKLKMIDGRMEDLGRTMVLTPELIPAGNVEIPTEMGSLGTTMVSAPQLIPSRNEEIQTQMRMQAAEHSDVQDAIQKQQWLVDVMNAKDGGNYELGDEFVMPCVDVSAPQLIPSRNEEIQTQMRMQAAEHSDVQDAIQKQQWLVDVMNAKDGGNYELGDEFVMPFVDVSAPQLIPSRNEEIQTQMRMQAAEHSDVQEAIQKQQWLVDEMNANDGGNYELGDEFVMPCVDVSAWP
ncbi:hypothetical protein ACHQM5_028727 [Ranunculus cassubicifolius]